MPAGWETAALLLPDWHCLARNANRSPFAGIQVCAMTYFEACEHGEAAREKIDGRLTPRAPFDTNRPRTHRRACSEGGP